MDLKRKLLIRVSLFALAIFLAGSTVILHQARQRVLTQVQRTGSTIKQLMTDEIARTTDVYHRTIHDLDLSGLTAVGELIHFCVEVENLDARPVVSRCFAEPGYAPALLRWIMGALIGNDVIYRSGLGQYPGIKVAEVAVRPDIASEAVEAWGQISILLWVTLGILLLNFLIYMPVRRALRPTEAILHALGRMEAGDLTARLPNCELIELQRISTVFNHMADRLQQTISQQQKLAEHLLTLGEEDRRHLARELHDELGQSLTSIKAEVAYANELARESLPELLPCTQAIARTASHMMESLQGLLRQLRPIGLEEFGLAAGLEQLVEGWNQRSHGRCQYRLAIHGELADFPDNLNVSLYRIVQESLTNATRHGEASEVEVVLRRGDVILLTIEDNGVPVPEPLPRPGMGVLGMHERVQALGGTFSLSPRTPRGMRVTVGIPLSALGVESL